VQKAKGIAKNKFYTKTIQLLTPGFLQANNLCTCFGCYINHYTDLIIIGYLLFTKEFFSITSVLRDVKIYPDPKSCKRPVFNYM